MRIRYKITQIYHYTYDPFGRRVTKTDAFGTTYFTWDGNRLLTESRGDSHQSYIYEQFGFTPIASTNQEAELNYYHNDHLGTPQEVTNNQGEIVWEAEYATWGNTAKVTYKQVDANIEEEVEFQPLRFQGQYHDAETGLHYNRFRYYDPDIGRFISQDPIGLLGGNNLYQYAPNPVGWIDPLGLAHKAPTELPDTPGIYIITNKEKSYVGSAGQGKQGMNSRISSSTHTHAQSLLGIEGTTVEFKEVNLGNASSRSDKNNILRHYEEIEFQKQKALAKTMLNDKGIQDPKKKANAEQLIEEHGASIDESRTICPLKK